MPIIYKHNLKHFASNQKIAHEPRMNPVYHYDNRETVQKEGDGIFSGIGSIVNLIKNNKDLITSAAKGAAAIGSTASAISNAVKSQNELKQLEAIRKLRNDSEELKNLKKLSEETKNKIANIAVGGETLRSGAPSDSKHKKKSGVAIKRSIEEIRGNGLAKF
jgi:hypothetical protein